MALQFGRFFTILDPGKLADKERILHELCSPNDEPNRAARRIRDLLLPISKTVILEDEYIDLDFRASYARFYIFGHFETVRRCRRMHFLEDEVKKESDLLDMSWMSPEGYLGYAVLRPFQTQMLGRSVFSERVLWASSPKGCEVYLTCRAAHRANIAGNELALMGAPWMQQDAMVSACASTSIWVVNWHMSHRFAADFKLYHTPQITDLAVQSSMIFGRAMPSGGLSFEQMMYGLREMGYDPIPFVPQQTDQARQALYGYVESGIPVIISFDYPIFDPRLAPKEGHTVTAVGHTLDRTMKPRPDVIAGMPFCRSSDFVPHFVVQDDAAGPFCFLELIDWTSAKKDAVLQRRIKPLLGKGFDSLTQQYPCAVVIDRGKQSERVALLNSFIIPLPLGIMLSRLQAEDRALALLASWYREAKHKPPPLVFRTFLQTSNELKQSWDIQRGMPHSLAQGLRSHLYSRWVWVSEVSTYNQFRLNEGQALGQVIQDSASQGETATAFHSLAFHMPPGDLQTTDPYGRCAVLPVRRYDSFPIRRRPGSGDHAR
jgi:hypothetical protein